MFFITCAHKPDSRRMVEIVDLIAVGVFTSCIQQDVDDSGMRRFLSFNTVVLTLEQAWIAVFHQEDQSVS